MTLRPLLLAIAAAIAILALRTASVRAQPEPTARAKAAAHVKQGQAFFRAADYDRALAEYQAALDLSAEPSLIFNIALCHDRANRPEQALEAFRRYLELAPDGAVADEARDDIARLTPIVDKIHADRRAEEARQRDEALRLRAAAAEAARPPPPRPSRVPLYVMIAGAAITLGGATTHALAWRTRDRVANAPDLDTYHDERDKLALQRNIAIGVYAAGALTIATGLVLRYTVFRAERVQLSLAVTPGGAAVTMEWSR